MNVAQQPIQYTYNQFIATVKTEVNNEALTSDSFITKVIDWLVSKFSSPIIITSENEQKIILQILDCLVKSSGSYFNTYTLTLHDNLSLHIENNGHDITCSIIKQTTFFNYQKELMKYPSNINIDQLNQVMRQAISSATLSFCVQDVLQKNDTYSKIFQDIARNNTIASSNISEITDQAIYRQNPTKLLEDKKTLFSKIKDPKRLEVKAGTIVYKDFDDIIDTGLSGRDSNNGELRGNLLLQDFADYMIVNPESDLYQYLTYHRPIKSAQDFLEYSTYGNIISLQHLKQIAIGKMEFPDLESYLCSQKNGTAKLTANGELVLHSVETKLAEHIYEKYFASYNEEVL